ncbi:hypothetical protein L1887_29197 [Cichorium endivia]|nr:hypothetical protein L1887_29197 [Cichorium endivia]
MTATTLEHPIRVNDLFLVYFRSESIGRIDIGQQKPSLRSVQLVSQKAERAYIIASCLHMPAVSLFINLLTKMDLRKM